MFRVSDSLFTQPLETCGNWPWNSQRTGGHADKRFRYTLLSVDAGPETVRCIGYSRRRRGRGGRIIFDRAFAEQRADFWDRVVDADLPTDTDATIEQPDNVENSSSENTFQEYIKNNRWSVQFGCELLSVFSVHVYNSQWNCVVGSILHHLMI